MEEVKKRDKRHLLQSVPQKGSSRRAELKPSESQLVLYNHLHGAEFLCYTPAVFFLLLLLLLFFGERGYNTGREECKEESYAVLLSQSECNVPARAAAGQSLYFHLSDTGCNLTVLLLYTENIFLHLVPMAWNVNCIPLDTALFCSIPSSSYMPHLTSLRLLASLRVLFFVFCFKTYRGYFWKYFLRITHIQDEKGRCT